MQGPAMMDRGAPCWQWASDRAGSIDEICFKTGDAWVVVYTVVWDKRCEVTARYELQAPVRLIDRL